MKRICITLLLISFLLAGTLSGCSTPTNKLQDALQDYVKMVEGDCPEDIRLTIYYIDPAILTRKPLTAEELKDFPGVQKITVESEELAKHFETFKKLTPSALHPVEENSGINARVYYVFETEDSGKILEVIICDSYSSVFVNGIEVENNPVFYDLIKPFLSEKDRNALGV